MIDSTGIFWYIQDDVLSELVDKEFWFTIDVVPERNWFDEHHNEWRQWSESWNQSRESCWARGLIDQACYRGEYRINCGEKEWIARVSFDLKQVSLSRMNGIFGQP